MITGDPSALAADARERGLAAPRNLMREEQRAEPRQDGAGQGATLFIRGQAVPGRVLDISPAGAMLETDAQPRLDEHLVVAFEGCTPVHACTRWVKDGRVGVHFGKVLVLA
jgi:hypothetical protein